MKANELRIGNYVEYRDERNKVCAILRNHIKIEGLKGSLSLSDVKPIQLTEEWMLKLGFEKEFFIDDLPIYLEKKARLETLLLDEYLYVNKRMPEEPWTTLRKIKYVHELQNLYFALTGEELTLK